MVQPESIYVETNREIEVIDVDDNSIELLDADCDKSSVRKVSNLHNATSNQCKEKQIAFQSFIVDVPVTTGAGSLCKLIGKVSPNLVKTWEQLNDANSNSKPTYVRSTSNDSEKILYPESTEVLLTSKPAYQVNHVVHSGSSEDFFDSIDGSKMSSDLDCLVSLCCEDNYAAGEVMAEFESLDRRKVCWSMESSRMVSGEH